MISILRVRDTTQEVKRVQEHSPFEKIVFCGQSSLNRSPSVYIYLPGNHLFQHMLKTNPRGFYYRLTSEERQPSSYYVFLTSNAMCCYLESAAIGCPEGFLSFQDPCESPRSFSSWVHIWLRKNKRRLKFNLCKKLQYRNSKIHQNFTQLQKLILLLIPESHLDHIGDLFWQFCRPCKSILWRILGFWCLRAIE